MFPPSDGADHHSGTRVVRRRSRMHMFVGMLLSIPLYWFTSELGRSTHHPTDDAVLCTPGIKPNTMNPCQPRVPPDFTAGYELDANRLTLETVGDSLCLVEHVPMSLPDGTSTIRRCWDHPTLVITPDEPPGTSILHRIPRHCREQPFDPQRQLYPDCL